MLPIALMAAVAWLWALLYYTKFRHLKEPAKEQWGVGFVFKFIAMFVGSILVFYFLSRLSAPQRPPGAPSRPPGMLPGLSPIQGLVIWLLGLMLFVGIIGEMNPILRHLARKTPGRWATMYVMLCLALGAAITVKIFYNPLWVGNLMLVTLAAVIAIEFVIRLKRSGFIAIFALIAVLDIALVWLTSGIGAGGGSAGGGVGVAPVGNWYIQIFRSEFMKHFPFPIGLRWDGRMLGNGDVFFLCLTVMYAKRIWSTKAAIIAGAVATLPVVLLPYAFLVLKAPPMAWPYTIFIAPVALFIGIAAPRAIKVPEAWKDLDGPEVIGRWPKSR